MINKWYTEEGYLTVYQAINAARLFFSQENIQKNPFLCLPIYLPLTESGILTEANRNLANYLKLKILEKIPPYLTYLLAFMDIRGIPRNWTPNSQLAICIPSINFIREYVNEEDDITFIDGDEEEETTPADTSDLRTVVCSQYSPQQGLSCSLADDNTWSTILTGLSNLHTAVERLLEESGNISSDIYFQNGNFIFSQLISYGTNQEMFHIFRTRDPNIPRGVVFRSPSAVSRMYTSCENFTVEVRSDEPWNIKITIVPAGVSSLRLELSEVFGHDLKVTRFFPKPILCKNENNNTPTFGVELELTTDLSVDKLIDSQKELFFVCKQDSSIRGSMPHAYELVTAPMSMKAQRKYWGEWFANTDLSHFDTSKKTNNGMHIHIGRNAFDKNWNAARKEYTPKIVHVKAENSPLRGKTRTISPHLRKMVYFITHPANSEFMLFLSERDADSLQRWAPIPNYASQNKKQLLSKCLEAAGNLRGAINLTNRETVEIRLFRGVVSHATLEKNLDIVESFIGFTKDTSYKKLSIKDYLEWLENQPKNKFYALRLFLKDSDIESMTKANEIYTLIFAEKSPHKMLDILKKSNIKIEEQELKLINNQLPQQSFLLKNGELILNPDVFSKLSKYDEIFTKRYLKGAK